MTDRQAAQNGFSLIEAIVVIAIAALAYLYFFRIVTLFLQTRSQQLVGQDIVDTSDTILGRFNDVSQNASAASVSSDSAELRITGSPCALMKYYPIAKSLGYSEDLSSNCSPPVVTSMTLNPATVDITALAFTPISSVSGVKSVRLTFTLYAKRPFATKSADFASAITIWKN